MKTLTIVSTKDKKQIKLQRQAIELSGGTPVEYEPGFYNMSISHGIHDNTGDWDVRTAERI